MANGQEITQTAKTFWKEILIILLAVGLCLMFYFNKEEMKQERLQQAKILEEAQFTTDALQGELKISKAQADAFGTVLTLTKTGAQKPDDYFVQTAPNPKAAAEIVAAKVNAKDPSLPKSATEVVDRNVVQLQPANVDYPIGIYKINLQKNWSWGTGLGVMNDKIYVPVELTRNFSIDRSVAGQVNIQNGKVAGGQVLYKVQTNKLFGIF